MSTPLTVKQWRMRRPGWLTCVYGGLLAAVVAFGGALLYLKLHESELVFTRA